LGFLFGPAESRQKHRRKDGDDRDHDQQLDQGEPDPVLLIGSFF
jgi:hypothetical protein